jgi:hypothetical protein
VRIQNKKTKKKSELEKTGELGANCGVAVTVYYAAMLLWIVELGLALKHSIYVM